MPGRRTQRRPDPGIPLPLCSTTPAPHVAATAGVPADEAARTILNLLETDLRSRGDDGPDRHPVGCKFPIAGATCGDAGCEDGGMCSMLQFLFVRFVFGVVRVGPGSDDNDVEIAVLRHQLSVLQRQIARPRFNDTDRAVLSSLAKLIPRDRWAVFLVTPATLIRWHRQLVRRHWTQRPSRPRRGLPQESIALVVRLGRENPRWRVDADRRRVLQARRRGVGDFGA